MLPSLTVLGIVLQMAFRDMIRAAAMKAIAVPHFACSVSVPDRQAISSLTRVSPSSLIPARTTRTPLASPGASSPASTRPGNWSKHLRCCWTWSCAQREPSADAGRWTDSFHLPQYLPAKPIHDATDVIFDYRIQDYYLAPLEIPTGTENTPALD